MTTTIIKTNLYTMRPVVGKEGGREKENCHVRGTVGRRWPTVNCNVATTN